MKRTFYFSIILMVISMAFISVSTSCAVLEYLMEDHSNGNNRNYHTSSDYGKNNSTGNSNDSLANIVGIYALGSDQNTTIEFYSSTFAFKIGRSTTDTGSYTVSGDQVHLSSGAVWTIVSKDTNNNVTSFRAHGEIFRRIR